MTEASIENALDYRISVMRLRLLWISVLLLLWAIPGCGRAKDEHKAVIVIAEGNSLFYRRARQDRPAAYGPGDTVVVEWKNGACYVNGRQYMPVPPKALPVARLRHLFGKVPIVIEYVRNHAGDSTEVWNAACRVWEEQVSNVISAAFRRYEKDLSFGESPDAAARKVAFGLRFSPLVDSAYVDETRSSPDSQNRYVMVVWAGIQYKEALWLEPRAGMGVPPGSLFTSPFTLEDFKELVRNLRRLEGKEPTTIDVSGRDVVVRPGPAGRGMH